MPHVNDVRPTSHDRHDPLLVAALAADDLAADDLAADERDQASALIRSCADCATLHDDLRALARATASAPPPVAIRSRDFRLTPADAARLRPSGWRRFAWPRSSLRPFLTRPLGVGLATLGLVGLLIGNVQLGSAGGPGAVTSGTRNAAGPEALPAASAPDLAGGVDTAGGAPSSAAPRTPVEAPVAAGSAAAPTASSAAGYGMSDQSVAPGKGAGGAAAPTASGPAEPLRDSDVGVSAGNGSADPFRAQNLLFGGAIVLGLALLVASRRRDRQIS